MSQRVSLAAVLAALTATLCIAACRPSLEVSRAPDLFPLPGSHQPPFCDRQDVGGVDSLVVHMKNQGADSGPYKVVVDFGPYGQIPHMMGPLGAGLVDSFSVPIPMGCFDSDCGFTIIVDAGNIVQESDETNNEGRGSCLG